MPVAAYQKAEQQTNSPLDEVIRVYDRVLWYLHQAELMSRLDDQVNSVCQAKEGIIRLLVSLDFDKSEEISKDLAALYRYILEELLPVNFPLFDDEERINRINQAIDLMNTINEGWRGIKNGTA